MTSRILADVDRHDGEHARITEAPAGYFVYFWLDGEHVETRGPFDAPEKAWGCAYER